MQCNEDEEQMEDPMVNTILIFDIQMINKFVNNNYTSEEFWKQRSEDDLLGVSTESKELFAQSFGVFTQTLDLLEQSAKKSIQLTNVLPQLIDKLT